MESCGAASERGGYRNSLELARRAPAIFEREVARALADPQRPVGEKTALLRAAYEAGLPSASGFFLEALTEEGPLPSFAVRYLCGRAEWERVSLAFLESQVMAHRSPSPLLRRDAARTVFRCSSEDELDRLLPRLLMIESNDVARGAVSGLQDQGTSGSRRLLSWLAQNHPHPDVRRTAEEALSSRRCLEPED